MSSLYLFYLKNVGPAHSYTLAKSSELNANTLILKLVFSHVNIFMSCVRLKKGVGRLYISLFFPKLSLLSIDKVWISFSRKKAHFCFFCGQTDQNLVFLPIASDSLFFPLQQSTKAWNNRNQNALNFATFITGISEEKLRNQKKCGQKFG